MLRIIFTYLLSILFISVLYGQNESYLQTFRSLIENKLDYESTIENYSDVIVREDITIKMNEGDLVFGQPIDDQVKSALFVGDGSITYEPSPLIEKQQLERYTDKPIFNENIKYIFFLFSDSTFTNHLNRTDFSTRSANSKFDKYFAEGLKYLYNESRQEFIPTIIKPFLDKKENGFFYVLFQTESGEYYNYFMDPFGDEEIQFGAGYNYINHRLTDIITQYKSQSHELNHTLKESDYIRTESYRVNVLIDQERDFSATSTITFKPRRTYQKWIPFYLYSKLEVDSVTSNQKALDYFKGDESEIVWVKFNSPLNWRNEEEISIHYHGNLLFHNTRGWIRILSSGRWIPKFGIRNYAKYDLTFKYPQQLTLIATGEKTSEIVKDEYKISRWVSKDKIRNASFNIGSFKEYTLAEKGIPEINVYHSRYGHNGSISNAEVVIAGEIKKSLQFFQDMYGKLTFDKVYASEIPHDHGEAFPGFIHLSYSTFQNSDYYGLDQVFRAHEVAHQWWAIDLDFETYRDQWLSEAFAEYSGLMYLEHEESLDKMLGYINDYRDKILYNRKYLLGDGQPEGPIYLGYRTSGRNTRGDYNLIIYKKGAFVLHMLRMMMIDLQTLNDDPFRFLMRDFFNSYQGGLADTYDFMKMVNKHFNNNMEWFFNQWIFDTFIPDIQFAYKTEKNSEGKTVVMCKTMIPDAPPDYQLYPIIKVYNSEGSFMRFRVPIKNGKTEFNLTLESITPSEVIFNDLESILCDYEEVDWDDI